MSKQQSEGPGQFAGEKSCLQDHLTMGLLWSTFELGAILVNLCLAAELTRKVEICHLSKAPQQECII